MADFVEQRQEWLRLVMRDRRISPFAFRVAAALSFYFNAETGEAWPSQETLAEDVGGADRGVRAAVEALVACGHLQVDVQRGRGRSNRYRMAGENRHGHTGNGRENRHGDAGYTDGKAAPGCRLSEQKTGMAMQENRHGHAYEHEKNTREIEGGKTPLSPIAISRPGKTPSPKPENDEAFATWWNLYPRREGKADARKAFDAVIAEKRATLAELSAGAMRFAAERERDARMTTDPDAWRRFTALPATWLRGERWLDEAPAVRSGTTIDEQGRTIAAPAGRHVETEEERMRRIYRLDPEEVRRHLNGNR